MADLVRNPRLPATLGILRPRLGHEQVAGQDTTKGILRIVIRIQQMLTDHAVVDLAAFAAPLPLDSRGLVALLAMARRIQHADSLPPVVSVGYQPHQLSA